MWQARLPLAVASPDNADVDPTTRANLLLFSGSMLLLGAFWFVVLGLGGGGALQVVAGVGCLIGAVWIFRIFGRTRR